MVQTSASAKLLTIMCMGVPGQIEVVARMLHFFSQGHKPLAGSLVCASGIARFRQHYYQFLESFVEGLCMGKEGKKR